MTDVKVKETTEEYVEEGKESLSVEVKETVEETPVENSWEKNKKLTTIMYVLMAVGIFIPFTYIATAIMYFIKRDEVADSAVIKSHFRWIIRTLAFGLLWAVIGLVTSVIVIGIFILIAANIWIVYRIAKGWMTLNDGKEMYLKKVK